MQMPKILVYNERKKLFDRIIYKNIHIYGQ
jgi:hypothetical protein